MRLPACGANSVSTIVVTIIHESKLRNFEWNLKAIFHRINNKKYRLINELELRPDFVFWIDGLSISDIQEVTCQT